MSRKPLQHRINNCLFTYKEIERYFGVPVKLAQKRYENGKRGKELIMEPDTATTKILAVAGCCDLSEQRIADLIGTTQQNVSRVLLKSGKRRMKDGYRVGIEAAHSAT